MKFIYAGKKYYAYAVGDSVSILGMDKATLFQLWDEVRQELPMFPSATLHEFTLWAFEKEYTQDLVEVLCELIIEETP